MNLEIASDLIGNVSFKTVLQFRTKLLELLKIFPNPNSQLFHVLSKLLYTENCKKILGIFIYILKN